MVAQGTAPYNNPNKGIKVETSIEQRLIFSLKAPITDITATAFATPTDITNSCGILFLMNPLFMPSPNSPGVSFEDNVKLSQHRTISLEFGREYGANSYNDFTYVKLLVSNTQGIFNSVF